MPVYEVCVSYEDVDIEDLDQVEVLLSELPDLQMSCLDGQTRIAAATEALSAVQAVEDFVSAIHRVAPDAVPGRVQLSLLAVSDIAEIVGLNREAVRLWSIGSRGPGGFPAAIDTVGDRIKVWAASEVYGWLQRHSLPCPSVMPLSPDEVTDSNRVIDRLRRKWTRRPYLYDAASWTLAKQDRVTVPVADSARLHAVL